MIFTADTATYDIINGAHVAGLAIGDGVNGYLLFQRCDETDAEDWGIYLELNDEVNSGYEIIKECKITRSTVMVELTTDFINEKSIEVSLAVEDEAFNRFVTGIREIFRGNLDLLKI